MASGEAYQLLSTNPSLDNSYRDSEDDYDGTSYLPTQPSRSRFTPRLLLRAAAAFTLFVLLSTLAALLLPISPLYLYPAASPTGRVERNPRISLSAYLHSQFNETDVVAWTFATETYVLAVRNWDARREEVGLPDMVVTLCLDEECLDEVERTGGRAYGGYLRKNVRLPRPTRRRRGLEERGELVKRGEERGHYMAWCKFKAMLEINQAGFNSFFFEGDTFFSEDPFRHMRSLDDPSWDMQFTEDIGYIMNFGWIFMRSCEATITYWEHTLQEYLRENQWDQSLISQVVMDDGGREMGNYTTPEHWWFVDDYHLRISLLPIDKFLANHIVAMDWYTPDPSLPEPIMHHLTAITYANRQFYPKEQGWWTNVDSYYTTPRAILTSAPLSGTRAQILADARLLSSVAELTGRAFMVPPSVSVLDPDGEIYVRNYTRVFSIETAIETHSDILEASFLAHASRYLPSSIRWAPPTPISLTSFSSATTLVEAILARPKDPYEVLRLEGFREARIEEWGVEWGVEVCREYEREGLPFIWCSTDEEG